MKTLLLILIVTLGACNGGEDQSLQNCISIYGQYGDTVHIQSVPSAGVALHNAGYDTSRALLILPPSEQ